MFAVLLMTRIDADDADDDDGGDDDVAIGCGW